MYEVLNTLYALTPGTRLSLDHDTVRVTVEGETRLRVPLVRLEGIVAVGRITLSPFLIHRCAEDGRSIVWLSRTGRFKARVEGPTRGNVLLRRAQHLALSDAEWPRALGRQFVAGKIQNSRTLLLRAAREAAQPVDAEPLRDAADRLADILATLPATATLDHVRGAEGDAARTYFAVFGHMVRGDRRAFTLNGRSKRPPRDRANAVLSFLYALVRGECAAALEGVGLDPQVGYLHALRPGRPALALDLMEELRPAVADRLALRLINRRQLQTNHFETTAGGAVRLTDAGRRAVVSAYQKRKEAVVDHRTLRDKVPLGLVPHLQARLLARHLRGDLAHYPPYLAR